MMPDATALIPFTIHQSRFRMLQFDMTLIAIWYIVPLSLLFLRAAYAGYKTKRKKNELKRVEEKSTPFTSKL
ncbi:hypothetical protein EU527_06850 [Candidatus Thorarchaeota archaeon]|nr:MAG: hypothetical protein EU527_06850 [Candidatus Thorarchaeota archaeon]